MKTLSQYINENLDSIDEAKLEQQTSTRIEIGYSNMVGGLVANIDHNGLAWW